jgi:hypothetical protein
MADQKIQVAAYSGYKADERPMAFVLDGEEIGVRKILERWMEEDFAERLRRRFFTVEGSDGYAYTLYRNEKPASGSLKDRDGHLS